LIVASARSFSLLKPAPDSLRRLGRLVAGLQLRLVDAHRAPERLGRRLRLLLHPAHHAPHHRDEHAGGHDRDADGARVRLGLAEQLVPEPDELILPRFPLLACVPGHGSQPYSTDTRALHPVARAWYGNGGSVRARDRRSDPRSLAARADWAGRSARFRLRRHHVDSRAVRRRRWRRVSFGITESLTLKASGFLSWRPVAQTKMTAGGTIAEFASMVGINTHST
jgi:hypothetical protein